MDPLSQGLLGAALAVSFARRERVRAAAIAGALGGMAADLDVLIRSDSDPLLAIEFHRHFTHALPFVPIGGLLVALGLWYLFRMRSMPFKLLYLFTTLGYLTHGLLDACTSYGTRLYWPLSNERVSWSIVSIIDPLFTIPLLIILIISLRKQSVRWMQGGLALCLAYLAFGWTQHQRAADYVAEIAAGRGHSVERAILNPTIFNNILWRSVYQSGGKYYVDAVYVPPFGKRKMREGSSVDVVNAETVFPELPADSQQRNDIARFNYFSQSYLYHHPSEPMILADLRYGTLPYDLLSMWGVKVNPATPDSHVTFEHMRHITDENLDEFKRMLRGNLQENPAKE